MCEFLLKKKVSIADPYVLLFFFPHFHIISDLKACIDYSTGVIYTGTLTDAILKKLNFITGGKYIILSEFPEVSLHKPSEFISVFYPTLKGKEEPYNMYSLEEFLPIFKQYYMLKKKPPVYKEEESYIFQLFKAMLSSHTEIEKVYFSLVDNIPVGILSSSLLTFLLKVKTQNYNNCSSSYKKLINSAYLKFGNKINTSINQYLESGQREDISLLFLLENLG